MTLLRIGLLCVVKAIRVPVVMMTAGHHPDRCNIIFQVTVVALWICRAFLVVHVPIAAACIKDDNEYYDNNQDHMVYHHCTETFRRSAAVTESRTLDEIDLVEDCGVQSITPEEARVDAANMAAWEKLEGRTVVANGYYTIPYHVHIVQSSDTTSSTSVTTDRVREYDYYLRHAFKDTVFSFSLQGQTRTTNTSWARNVRDGNFQIEMNQALKQGGMETLNVYIVESLPPPTGQTGASYTGFAYLPSSLAAKGWKDGVVLQRTFAGDTRRANTLVHEVGHWLGLLHTFAGGCDPNSIGDMVDDTPAHQSGGQKCSNVCCDGDNWDSCPLLSGLDPVDNYMTYTQDNNCRTRFTEGQMQRMRAQYELYRLPAPMEYPAPTEYPAPMEYPILQPTIQPSPAPVPKPVIILPQCFFWLRRCQENDDCCFGACRPFLWISWLPNVCSIF